MTFQRQPKRRRFGQLFNRSEKKRKNKILDQSSSKRSLLSSQNRSYECYDSSKVRRSAESKRHLNGDGSSFDQLNELCKKLPKEEPITTTRFTALFGKESEDNSIQGKTDSITESQRTLKSNGSSGKELQMILEKLMLEENKHKQIKILPQNDMHQKKICNHEITTPPLQASRVPSSPKRSSPSKTISSTNSSPKSNPSNLSMQPETPSSPNSQNKFRFEMIDSNQQARLYQHGRKRSKKKKKRNTQNTTKESDRLLKNCDLMSGLEVKSNSDASMSSCSIDSILEDKARRRHLSKPSSIASQNGNQFESLSCKASQLADQMKTTFIDSYDIASTWFGHCITSTVTTDEEQL